MSKDTEPELRDVLLTLSDLFKKMAELAEVTAETWRETDQFIRQSPAYQKFREFERRKEVAAAMDADRRKVEAEIDEYRNEWR